MEGTNYNYIRYNRRCVLSQSAPSKVKSLIPPPNSKMDSPRDSNRVVRFRDTHHEPDFPIDFYKLEANQAHGDSRDSRSNLTHDHYDQTVPLVQLPPECSRNKLDHLMFIRRNIVESLNLLSNERQSLFQNQHNCYQEARQFLQERSRAKGRNRQSNLLAMTENDRSYHRYHTINDIPRIRYYPDSSKPTELSFRGDIPAHSPNRSYFKATTDSWFYPPSCHHNLANQSVPLISSELETEKCPVHENQSQKRPVRSQLSDNYLQSWDNFLERSWPKRRSSANSKANGDLIRYLDMVEENELKPPTKPCLQSSQRTFRESREDRACFDQQFQRPVEMVTERSQLNHPFDKARGLSSDSMRQSLTLNHDIRIKRRSSPDQELNSFGSHLSSPRRSETRESYDENSSSLFSSEADSDFLFYPCTSMAPTPPLPSLTTSLRYVSDLHSPTQDMDLPPRKGDNLFHGSLDDITKQFYLDDDALSDDVFIDDYQAQASMENGIEDWLRYLDHSQRQDDKQTKESNLYANIGQRLSGGMATGIIEKETPVGTSSLSPNSENIDLSIVTRPKMTENASCGVLKSEIKEDDPDNNGSLDDSAECEDLCSGLSSLNLNLANAFDSLRRNSTQSKSRRLWKERRTRMKKSPARQYRSLTPRFEESVTETVDTVNGTELEPRYFTFDMVDRTSASKEDLSPVKKTLRGILKNKITSHVPKTDAVVEYDYCDMRRVANEENVDCKETNEDQSNLLIVQENKINEPLLICVNDESKKIFVSVGIQVDLLKGSVSNLMAEDFFKTNEGDGPIEDGTLNAVSDELEKPPISTPTTDFVCKGDARAKLLNNPEEYKKQLDTLNEVEALNCPPKVETDKDFSEASNPLNVTQGLRVNLDTSSDSESKCAGSVPQKPQYVRRGRSSDSDICTKIQRPDRCAGISMESFPASEVLLSKDDHEFHYLRSPTETGTTETIAVRKNSLEVYKWTRSWQRREKNQIKKATNKECNREDLGSNEKVNVT